MSDGISDAHEESDLARAIWEAAFHFREATSKLGRAIRRARNGHRGWAIARVFIVRETNEALQSTGFKLVDADPQKAFEYYPDAYGPDE